VASELPILFATSAIRNPRSLLQEVQLSVSRCRVSAGWLFSPYLLQGRFAFEPRRCAWKARKHHLQNRSDTKTFFSDQAIPSDHLLKQLLASVPPVTPT
jgi:hypothetical protein